MVSVTRKISSHKNNKIRDILSTLPMCMLLAAGSFISWFKIASISLFYEMIVFGVVEISLCLCALYSILSARDKERAFFIPACGAAALILTGIPRTGNGLVTFLNVCIYSWNEKYEDGVRLFGQAQANETDLFLFSLIFLLLLAAALWYLISVGACARLSVIALLIFIPEMVLGHSSAFGAVLMLTSITGVWLFSVHAGTFSRRVGWNLVVAAALICLCMGTRGKYSQTVLDGKKQAAQIVEHFRYGKDSMPDGNLKLASSLEQGNEVRLNVKTEQIKALYLKGYTGSDYENDSWKPLSKAAYGGNRWGFLKWLKGRGFTPEHQYVTYEEAGRSGGKLPENAPWMNHVQVVNTGAKRKQIYEPYSAVSVKNSTGERDEGSRSTRFFGAENYEFDELSPDMPGELQRLDAWAAFPETEEQSRYMESEAVYRDFVYENYVGVDSGLSGLITDMFHKDSEEGDLSVYSAVQKIRTVLEENTYYSRSLDAGDLPEDQLLRAFLRGECQGNSAFYASASVMALRSFHIPARYAEGYLLTSKEAEESHGDWINLSSYNSHAWVEVYMDGMGWLPVDMTPGYYYDTFALLNMAQAPGQVRKVAALETDGEEAENLKKHFPGGEQQGREAEQPVKNKKEIGWGLLILLLLLLELIFAVLELRRMYYEYRIRSNPRADFLFQMIYRHLLVFGITMQPGFDSDQIQKRMEEILPEMNAGLYLRVNELLEKYVYGGEELEEYEVRLLHQFLIKIRDSRKKLEIFKRLRLRYCIFS